MTNSLLFNNPIDQFQAWFAEASKDPLIEQANALCLSTVNEKGRPTARMLLLKDATPKGFTVFTNSNSPKAKDMEKRPYAALTFHWPSQRRQIRVEGKVIRHAKRVADAYFATRPRLSQVGSWASKQSQPLVSRELMLEEFDSLVAQFEGKKIPVPAHWNGYLVVPDRVEFWQERPNRLHDRWVYSKNRIGRWTLTRLYP